MGFSLEGQLPARRLRRGFPAKCCSQLNGAPPAAAAVAGSARTAALGPLPRGAPPSPAPERALPAGGDCSGGGGGQGGGGEEMRCSLASRRKLAAPRARRREGQGLFEHVRPERVGRRKAMAMTRKPPLAFQTFGAHQSGEVSGLGRGSGGLPLIGPA